MNQNGLSERVLLFYQRRSTQVDLEKMTEQSEILHLQKIYMEHNTKPPVKYTLTASAKKLFFKYSIPSEKSQSTSPSSCEGSTGSKMITNKLRVALNMHVLYHRLKKNALLRLGLLLQLLLPRHYKWPYPLQKPWNQSRECLNW